MGPKAKRGGKCFKMDYPLEKSAGMVYNKEVEGNGHRSVTRNYTGEL